MRLVVFSFAFAVFAIVMALPAFAQAVRLYGNTGFLTQDGRISHSAIQQDTLSADDYIKIPLNASGSIQSYRYRPRAYNCTNYIRGNRGSRLADRAYEIQSTLGHKGFNRTSLQEPQIVTNNRHQVVCNSGAGVSYSLPRRQRGYFKGRQ